MPSPAQCFRHPSFPSQDDNSGRTSSGKNCRVLRYGNLGMTNSTRRLSKRGRMCRGRVSARERRFLFHWQAISYDTTNPPRARPLRCGCENEIHVDVSLFHSIDSYKLNLLKCVLFALLELADTITPEPSYACTGKRQSHSRHTWNRLECSHGRWREVQSRRH